MEHLLLVGRTLPIIIRLELKSFPVSNTPAYYSVDSSLMLYSRLHVLYGKPVSSESTKIFCYLYVRASLLRSTRPCVRRLKNEALNQAPSKTAKLF